MSSKSPAYDQPLMYKVTALWGRMSGSLLFWLWLVTLFGALVVWTNRRATDYLADYALIPISIVQLFFIILVTGLVEGVYNPLEAFTKWCGCSRRCRNESAATNTEHGFSPTLALCWLRQSDRAVCLCCRCLSPLER